MTAKVSLPRSFRHEHQNLSGDASSSCSISLRRHMGRACGHWRCDWRGHRIGGRRTGRLAAPRASTGRRRSRCRHWCSDGQRRAGEALVNSRKAMVKDARDSVPSRSSTLSRSRYSGHQLWESANAVPFGRWLCSYSLGPCRRSFDSPPDKYHTVRPRAYLPQLLSQYR